VANPNVTFPKGRVLMKVKAIAMDPEPKNPVMILTDRLEMLFLPIWIGASEAAAIIKVLENQSNPRPMTHDLFHSTIVDTGWRVTEVDIHTLSDQTYFAKITLADRDGRRAEHDARPSDAVALALRAAAPIYVSGNILTTGVIVEEAKLSEALEKAPGPVPLE